MSKTRAWKAGILVLLPSFTAAAPLEVRLEPGRSIPAVVQSVAPAAALSALPAPAAFSLAPLTARAIASRLGCVKAPEAFASRAALEAQSLRIHDAVQTDPQLRNLFDGWGREDALREQDRIDAALARAALDVGEHEPGDVDARERSKRPIIRRGKVLARMRASYVGEERGGRRTWNGQTPVYLTRAQAREHEPLIKDGLFHDRAGTPLHGVYKIVQAAGGTVHVVQDDVGDRAHSSLLSGRAAAAAGTAAFVDGRLVALGPQTGHYAVARLFLAQLLVDLKARGAAIDRAALLPLIPYDGPRLVFERKLLETGREPPFAPQYVLPD